MKNNTISFIITPLLFGFLIGGFLFFNNNLQNFILNNSQDFSNLNVVWGRGSGEIYTLSSENIFISNKRLKAKFNLTDNFESSINPATEREEYMHEVEKSAETCSSIEFNQIEKYKLRSSDLSDIKVGEKADYFLVFNRKKEQFEINHLIVKR